MLPQTHSRALIFGAVLTAAILGPVRGADAPAEKEKAAAPPAAQTSNVIGPVGSYNPKIKEASDEAEKAIRTFKAAPGVKIDLFAAEPMLANPVCLSIDNKGRVYVAETFRHHAGVTDMRGHRKWLDDDLAARTVEDRLAAMKKNLKLEFLKYGVQHDRVRLIEDTDNDGKADKATVFADGFKDPLDGIGAGLLTAANGDVYFTNLPHLWKLRDNDGDGKSDERDSLSEGYGVHIGFLGHDLHGLRRGPDGRIYFSIGDRGVHIKTKEGRLIDLPDVGAVFRCEMDGSDLEVFHSGLRNPQELVFTELGDLFTGDNNSDAGDKARWVYLVPGGETGWCIGWQWLQDPTPRGPWNKEGMWKPREENPALPAYILPAIANIGSGPSGVTYDPGVGFGDHYRGRFFMCDFRGSKEGSLIHSFHLKPKGATFEVTDLEELIKGVLATDVDFGPDGSMYLTDWIQGWDQPKAGRIYKLTDTAAAGDPRVAVTKKLLAAGFAKKKTNELADLLAYPDQRVRLEAQWELAGRGLEGHNAFMGTLERSPFQMAKIHAIWGLGQGLRLERADKKGQRADVRAEAVATALGRALRGGDAELERQAARVLGDLRIASENAALLELVKGGEARVQFAAATALGQIGGDSIPNAQKIGEIDAIVDLLRRNSDQDAYVRHAGVMGLVGLSDEKALVALASDPSPSARMGVLLALRRLNSPEVGRFLKDARPSLVVEAARAINDRGIEGGYPALAALIDGRELLYAWSEADRKDCLEPTLLRALNANFRLGGDAGAKAIAALAADARAPSDARLEAVRELADWADPRGVDRVTGVWRPLGKRDGAPALAALRAAAPAILADAPENVLKEAAKLVGDRGVAEAEPALLKLVLRADAPAKARALALRSLADVKSPNLKEAVLAARASGEPDLRSEGSRQLSKLDPAQAIPLLRDSFENGDAIEKQGAVRTLAELKTDAARAELALWLNKLENGEAPPETRFELIEVAAGDAALTAKVDAFRKKNEAGSPVEGYSELLAGGRAEEGGKVFFEKVEAQCQRCHQVGGKGGGEVGPKLDDVGKRKDRTYILESIVFPNRQIAPGYENVTLTMKEGGEIAGRVVREDDNEVELEIPLEPEGEEFIEDDAEGAKQTDAKKEAAKTDAPAKPAVAKISSLGKKKLDQVINDGENNPHPADKPTLEHRVVKKADVTGRTRNLSSMPEGLIENLTRGDIRDIVEFLATQK